jgi:hypothetical protein
MIRAAAIAAVVAACSSLDALDRDVCGNGIVEAGEDCDGSPGCLACGIQCATTAQCTAFDPDGGTAGFVCGADGFCHAPAGAFHPPRELTVAVDTLQITDVDRDGIGDLVIQAPTALHVSLGNPDGVARLDSSILTPIARGPASYADLDLDGTADLLLPTSDGIAAYTSPFGVMTPFPFPSLITETQGVPLFAHPIDVGTIGFLGTQGTDDLLYLALDVRTGGTPMPLAPVCGAKAPQFSARHVDVYDVSPGHLVIAVTLDPAGASRLCLLAIDRQPDESYTATAIAAPAVVPAARAVLARLRGPGCPSLVVRTAAALVEYRPAGAAPPCGFGAPVALAAAPGAVPVGWTPLVPRSAGADFALVLSSGVFAFTAGALVPLYAADRPLAIARFDDLDGDGDLDLVATARDAEDLDVLYRAADGFVRFRFDTDGPVLDAMLGDFDGNGLVDAMITEQRVRGGVASEDLAIAYGTRDRLLPGATVGSFKHVISVLPASIPDSNDQSNLVADCAVLFESDTGREVSLLHGSPQRTLIGYFDPRSRGGSAGASLFRGAVAGKLHDAGATGLDVAAIETVDTDGLPAQHRTDVWLSRGPTGGNTEPLVPVRAPELARCDAIAAPDDAFCVGDARYVPWPMPRGTDRVIGLDPRGRGLAFAATDVDGAMTLRPQRWPAGVLAIPAGARVRDVAIAVLDDAPRLVVAYTGGVALCDLDAATGQPIRCTDLGAVISAQVPGGRWTCTDAAAAHVAPFRRFDREVAPRALVVLCRTDGGSGALVEVAVGGEPVATRLLDVLPADELRIGDVTGDRIDDVIAISRGGAISTLRIYPQCTSRDRCDAGAP